MNCHECGVMNEPNDLYVCGGHLHMSEGANAELADQLNQQTIFCASCYICGHFTCSDEQPLSLFDYLIMLNDEELENDLLESEREVKQIISQFHQLENFLKEKKQRNQSMKLSDHIKTVLAKVNANLASVNADLSATLESILSQNLAEAETTEIKLDEQKVATPLMKEESIMHYNRDLTSFERKENVTPVPSEQHYVSKERMQLIPEESVEEVTAMIQRFPNFGFSGQDFNARPRMQLKKQHRISDRTTRLDDGSDDGLD